MLHKTLTKEHGFRSLTADELVAVSGGDIIVAGDRPNPDPPGGGVGPLMMFEMMHAGGTDHLFENDNQEAPPDLEAEPVLWWLFLLSDAEESFENWLKDEHGYTDFEVDSHIIVEGSIGDDDFIIMFGPDGNGNLFRMTGNSVTGFEFTPFSSVSVSAGFNESSGASASNSGGSFNISEGGSLSITFTGQPNF